MMLRGHICSLRAVEPQDLELLCRWEKRSFVVDSQRYDRTVLALFDRTIHPGAAGWYLPMRTTAVDDRRHSGGNDRSHRLVRFRAAARTGRRRHSGLRSGTARERIRGRGIGFARRVCPHGTPAAATVVQRTRGQVPSLTLFERAGFRRSGLKRSGSVPPKGIRTKYCSKSCFRQFEIQICRNFPAR